MIRPNFYLAALEQMGTNAVSSTKTRCSQSWQLAQWKSQGTLMAHWLRDMTSVTSHTSRTQI